MKAPRWKRKVSEVARQRRVTFFSAQMETVVQSVVQSVETVEEAVKATETALQFKNSGTF